MIKEYLSIIIHNVIRNESQLYYLIYLMAIAIFSKTLPENHPYSLTINNHFRGFLQQMIEANRVEELSEHPFTQQLFKEISGG